MYGMVNKFLKDIVTDYYGQDVWDKAHEMIDEDIDFFIGMEQYPDDITYEIVGAVSEVANVPADELLENIGKGWVSYTSAGEYGTYYSMADDIFGFLKKLNSIHSALGTSMLNLRPPSFNLVEEGEGMVRLHYVSERPGLTPFVTGVLKGLAQFYGQKVSIEVTAEKQSGADHDEFLISVV